MAIFASDKKNRKVIQASFIKDYHYLVLFVETPRKFITAKLSIRKPGSSLVPIICDLFNSHALFIYKSVVICWLASFKILIKRHINHVISNKSHIISTDEDPGLWIESFAVINLRGVSTNKTIYFIAMQTYKELIIIIVIMEIR